MLLADVVSKWSLACVRTALCVVGAPLVVGGEEVVVDAALAAPRLDPADDDVACDAAEALLRPDEGATIYDVRIRVINKTSEVITHILASMGQPKILISSRFLHKDKQTHNSVPGF